MGQILVGLPCSPSKIIGQKVIKAKRILITYGGGMGGANKTYYFTKQKKLADGLLQLTLVDGKKVEVNPFFIVDKNDCKILQLKTDITAHCNYHSNTLGTKSKIETEYIYLDENETFTMVDRYVPRHEGELNRRVILKDFIIK